MYADISRVLIGKQQIQFKVSELAKRISYEYAGRDLLMICILRGATVFFADLIRAINIPVRIDFMSVSSYGKSTSSSGEVRIVQDIKTPIEDKDVIIVEDIIDSGNTLFFLKGVLSARNPSSLKICALLDKPSRREKKIDADFVGFQIPNEFVVGYGLDYADYYRNLPEICILDPKKYRKNA